MKTQVLAVAIALLSCISAKSQEAINYQAVIRNASNELVVNTEIGFEFGILVGGDQVYVERHAVFTDMNGQLSLKIGNGTVVFGIFDSIKWGSDYMEILIRCDIDGDAIYDIINTEVLNSVPYAHYAQNAISAETSADNKWTGSGDVVYTLSPDVNVGIGTATPGTKLAVNGAVSLTPAPAVIIINTDNFLVEVGNRSYLQLQSDNNTAAERTIILSDGLAPGQLLILQGNMLPGNYFEVCDGVAFNTNVPVTRSIGNSDTISFIWSGTAWVGLSFSDNE